MNKLKLLLNKPIIRKALHTFYQAAVPVFLAGYYNVLHAFQGGGLQAGKAAGLALLVAVGAAGISAVKTAYIQSKQ